MSDLEPRVSWSQAHGESQAEHAWLMQYIDLGETRTPSKAARRCGVSVALVKAAAAKWAWKRRAADFDAAVKVNHREWVADEKEALYTQYMVGRLMLTLAAKGLDTKNPTLFDMKIIRPLLQEGAELMRRGAGVADIKISHETRDNVEESFRRLLGEGDDA